MTHRAKRPSPRQSAAETEPGTILRGGDRAKWIVKEVKSGIKRWVRIPDEKGKVYLTHANGGRPYKVVIGKKGILIFAMDPDVSEDVYFQKVLHLKKYVKVYVGTYKGPFYKVSASDNGNSLLVHVAKNKYVFIGDIIYSFSVPDVIQAFQSPVGNSDVPYPWAIGNENIYLLTENVFIPHEMRNRKYCPYTQFYFKLKPVERKRIETKCKIPGRKVIHSFRAKRPPSAARI